QLPRHGAGRAAARLGRGDGEGGRGADDPVPGRVGGGPLARRTFRGARGVCRTAGRAHPVAPAARGGGGTATRPPLRVQSRRAVRGGGRGGQRVAVVSGKGGLCF